MIHNSDLERLLQVMHKLSLEALPELGLLLAVTNQSLQQLTEYLPVASDKSYDFQHIYHENSNNITAVVGQGGTGLVTTYEFSKLTYSDSKFIFIDPDICEYKNLDRQYIDDSFLGLPKVVMSAFLVDSSRSISISKASFCAEEFTTDTLEHILDNMQNNQILMLCGCTDSMKFRREMYDFLLNFKDTEYAKDRKSIYYIDSGNEDLFGQVSISEVSRNRTRISRIFTQLVSSEIQKQVHLSCADLEQSWLSNLFAGLTVALFTKLSLVHNKHSEYVVTDFLFDFRNPLENYFVLSNVDQPELVRYYYPFAGFLTAEQAFHLKLKMKNVDITWFPRYVKILSQVTEEVRRSYENASVSA